MKIPPLLLPAALLFWGWQTGMLVFAVLLALALELPRWVEARLEFADTDFRRIRDLTAVLILGAAVYTIVTRGAPNEIAAFFQAANYTSRNRSLQEIVDSGLVFVQWWPLLLLPLAAAQRWSTAQSMPFHIYSYILGRKKRQPADLARGRVDVAWPYFLVVLLSACATNTRSAWFYPALCLLTGWALWSVRPRRVPAWFWAAVFAATAGAGHWGHHSIRGLQSYLDSKFSDWLNSLMRREPGHLEARTAMGQVGRKKLSGRIVIRLEAEGAPPALLRDSSYDLLEGTTWSVTRGKRGYEMVPPDGTDLETWRLLPDKAATSRVVISMPLDRRQGWLSVPNGTAVLSRLNVGEVYTNKFGFIRLDNPPGLVRFTASYGPGPTADHPPALEKEVDGWSDLDVPEAEQEHIRRIVRELGLRRKPLDAQVEAVTDYFSRNFTYTTWLKGREHLPRPGETALGRFLTTARSGHCEYFATATVLLLRAAGVPARYANGYSVQEKKGGQYIVRERHAHAWALYWDERDKAWHDLDTTPGGWAEVEARENASLFEPVRDFFSNVWHAFSVWRWTGEKGAMRKYILHVIVLLVAVLVWRLARAGKRARKKADLRTEGMTAVTRMGTDSAFYQIERKLTGLGLERRAGESLSCWLARIEPLTELPVAELRPLLALHYRCRFDPRGLSRAELALLAQGASGWLARLPAPAAAAAP